MGQGFHYSTPKKMVMIHINLEPSVQSSQKSDPSLPDQDLSLTLGPWPHAPWLVPFRGAKMYFINSGKLAYFSGYSEKMPKLISAGRWMCEPVLWHLGKVTPALHGWDLAANCCSAVGCGTGSWKSIYQPLCCCCRKSCGFSLLLKYFGFANLRAWSLEAPAGHVCPFQVQTPLDEVQVGASRPGLTMERDSLFAAILGDSSDSWF